MANKIYEEEYIRDIANAIREKNGTQNNYLVSEMGNAIRAIEGSEGIPDVELTVVDSGVCGESVYWNLYDNGLLRISGQGNMYDYNNNSPFYFNRNILNVVIDYGVTNIGDDMFYCCNKITTVSIPSSVKSIGSYAFSECHSLENILIPDGVEIIGNFAFNSCSSLKSIIIPKSVTLICSGIIDNYNNPLIVYYTGTKDEWNLITVYSNNDTLLNAEFCYNYEAPSDPSQGTSVILQEKTITENGEYIADDGYDGFSKVIVQVKSAIEDDLSNLTLVDSGVCGESAHWELYDNGTLYINGSGETFDYRLGNENISPFREREDINKVIFNDEITRIGDYLFVGSSTITDIIIGNNVKIIGEGAFVGINNIKNITLPDGLTKIEANAFEVCVSLESIIIPSSIKTIEHNVFMDCSKMSCIYYKGTKDEWNSINIDSTNDDELSNIQICYNYQETTPPVIGDESISGSELTVVDSGVCGESAYWSLYDNGALYVYGSGDMNDYYDTTSPFENRTDVLDIVISEGITRIGGRTFCMCESVKTITLPSTLLYIEDLAFSNCVSITKIVLPQNLQYIDIGVFYGCINLVSVVMYNNITTVFQQAFEHCENLSLVYYCGSKEQWNTINFYAEGNEAIILNAEVCYNYQEPSDPMIGDSSVIESGSCGDNATWTFYNDGRFVVSGVGETYGYNSSSDRPWNEYCAQVTSLEIKEGISIIGWGMFAKFENVENIIIPHGVIEIKGSAFESCSTLKYITIPNSVTTIGDGAFYNVNNLVYILYAGTKIQWDSITKGSLNTSLNESKLCCNYQTTYLYQTIEKNGTVVFKPENGQLYNQAIINVNVPQATTEEQEKSITITENGTTEVLPDEGKTLSKVIIDVDVLSGDNGGSDNEKFKSLLNRTITEVLSDDLSGMTKIHEYTFYNCSKLTNVTIPNSVTALNASAFYGCSNLINIVIPNSVITVGNNAFTNCTKLTSATIGNSVTTIGSSAFSFCRQLSSITIPNSVTIINASTFHTCDSLISAIIGNSVTTIGDSAFRSCKKLSSITIPSSVTSIGSNAFIYCSALTDIYMRPAIPPTLGSSSAIPSTTTVHVPVGSGDVYKSATYWADYTIIEDSSMN